MSFEHETHEPESDPFSTPIPSETPLFRGAPRPSSSSTLLLLFGSMLTLAGVALVAAPQYSWRVTKLGQQLAGLGIDAWTWIVGGVVLVSIGGLARAVSRLGSLASEFHDEDSDLALVTEQMAAEVSGLRETLEDLSDGLSRLVSAHGDLAARVERASATPPEGDTMAGGEQSNALFRLAASLDQLGARMESHMSREIGVVSSRMDSLDGALETARTELETAIDRLQAPEPVATRTAAVAAAEVHGSPSPHEGGDDELEVIVDLDDEEPDLGLFDEMERMGAYPPAEPTPAPPEPPRSSDPYGAMPPATPSREDPGTPPAPPASWQSSIERLLPDDSVRRALDQGRENH